MTAMTVNEAQRRIDACRHMLDNAESVSIKDDGVKLCIGSLIIAIEQLAEVVEDLSNHEQGKAIQ